MYSSWVFGAISNHLQDHNFKQLYVSRRHLDMSASQLFGHDASDMFGSVKVMISNLRTMNKLSSIMVGGCFADSGTTAQKGME